MEIKRETPQEIFDTVVTHLRKQGCKSENTSSCLYRGPNGIKCAVGCLISDKEYKPSLDSRQMVVKDLLLPNTFISETLYQFIFKNEKLLSSLQNIHDDFEPSEWEEQFVILAEEFNLEFK